MNDLSMTNEATFFYTIEKPVVAEFKDRGSRFIAFAYPVETTEDFKKQLLTLKKEHPKAAHHCFAYRIGTDGNNFRVSDDGEPSGTAGRPILVQLDSRQLTNVAVIVVRYFGGTLLGVTGLINAYKTVSALALQITPAVRKQVLTKYMLQFDYTRMNDIMMILKQFNCLIIKQEQNLFCIVTVTISLISVNDVLQKLKEIPGLDIIKS